MIITNNMLFLVYDLPLFNMIKYCHHKIMTENMSLYIPDFGYPLVHAPKSSFFFFSLNCEDMPRLFANLSLVTSHERGPIHTAAWQAVA